jgi:ElaB/YqjD/DUF883 family membrane-anchored ribosome-binding protein
MNTDTQSKPIANQLEDAAGEVGRGAAAAVKDAAHAVGDSYEALSSKVGEGVERTKEYARHAVDASKDAAHRATDSAKDIYQSASVKAGDALETSREYAREHPLPVALGTLIVGVCLGYMIGQAQREELTFRQRLFS